MQQAASIAGLAVLAMTSPTQTILAASVPKFSVAVVYRQTDTGSYTEDHAVFKINAFIPLPISLQDVDEATYFQISLAPFDGDNSQVWPPLSGVLGEDPKYAAGRTNATFSDPAKHITLSWSANTLSITGDYNEYTPGYGGIVPLGQQASFSGLWTNGIQVVFGNARFSELHPYVYSGNNNVRDSGRTDETGNPIMLNNGKISISADFAPPALAIAYPRNNLTVTNDSLPLPVQFSARDGGGLANPAFLASLNGASMDVSASMDTPPANRTAVCSVSGLNPGTNLIAIWAYDSSGNVATTNLSIFYSVPIAVADVLHTNGSGTIKGLPANNMVEIGRAYLLTAVPGPGQVFVSWDFYYLGQFMYSSALNPCSVTFDEGWEVEATFVANPYPALAGSYNGIFQDDPLDRQTAGAIAITSTANGTFSGKVTMTTGTVSFSGKLLYGSPWAGSDWTPLVLSGRTNWLFLSLGVDPGDIASYGMMTGDIYFEDLDVDASFNAGRIGPASQDSVGVWNFIVDPVADDSTGPNGYSFGTLTLRTNGTASGTMSIADINAPVTITSWATAPNTMPLFTSLYSGSGFVISALNSTNFDAAYPTDIVSCGTIGWLKGPGKPFYPEGFAASNLWVMGAKYVPRAAGTYSGAIFYGGAGLSDKSKDVTIQNNGTIKVTGGNEDSLTGTVSWTTGAFSGSIKDGSVSRTFKGIMVGYDADGMEGAGFFLGTSQSGFVWLSVQ